MKDENVQRLKAGLKRMQKNKLLVLIPVVYVGVMFLVMLSIIIGIRYSL